jgi:HK97 family phage prohead protease
MEVYVDFKVYTNALKAFEAPNGDLIVSGTTSSTIRDLHGDEMTLNALHSMADTARQNMTIFLNHNYNVPEDLFGSVTDARVVKRFDAENGAEVYDLDIDVLVCKEDENPEAMRAYKAIKRGVKLGLSIGARVDRVSKRKDSKTGEDSYVIDSVKLMEASVVGIPANQRSYLQNAIKSLKAAEKSGEIVVDEKAEGLSAGDFVAWGSSGGTARGKITRVVRDGNINVPDSDFTITGTPEDPAALIRVYRKGSEGWAPSDRLVGHKFSTLRKIEALKSALDFEGQVVTVFDDSDGDSSDAAGTNNSLEETPSGIESAANEPTEIDSSPAVSIDTVEVVDEYEQKGDVDSSANSLLAEGDTIVETEKATRVTVTVTQSDDKETKKPAEENQALEAAGAEAPADVAKSDTEPVAEPVAEPVVEVPAEEPAAEEPAAEEPAAEEPATEEAADPAVEVLEALGAVLVRASADERARIISKVAELALDGEPEAVAEAEEPTPEVTPEVVEEPAVAPVEPEAEVAVEASAVEEVTAIAKSALDAAFAAQQEVAAVKAQLTELLSQKATVEADLAKALDVVGRLMDLPSGRKSYSVAKNNSGTKAPWLSPVIQRMLDSEE